MSLEHGTFLRGDKEVHTACVRLLVLCGNIFLFQSHSMLLCYASGYVNGPQTCSSFWYFRFLLPWLERDVWRQIGNCPVPAASGRPSNHERPMPIIQSWSCSVSLSSLCGQRMVSIQCFTVLRLLFWLICKMQWAKAFEFTLGLEMWGTLCFPELVPGAWYCVQQNPRLAFGEG